MRHPDHGVLRRLLDEPAGVPDTDRGHVADCPHCLGVLVALRDEALPGPATVPVTAPVIAPVIAPVTAPVTARGAERDGTGSGRAAGTGRLRDALRRPVVAGLGVAVVLAGAGTAAANDWLQIFRTERIAPVSVTAADLVAVPDLSEYGDVVVTGDGDVHPVPDAAAAAGQTGLDVPEITTLPRGVTGEPVYQVGGEVSAELTFSADRAARAAADAGTTLPPPPPGLDGAQLRLDAGPGVAQIWSQRAGVPSLVVGRAVAPSASSTGIPFETARDYLLSLPGVPEDVVAQLRTFSGDGSTLPLPVPSDHVTVTSAEVAGVPATVLTTRDRTMSAVVWVDDGVVTAVAGSVDADEVLDVARNLR